MYQKYNNNQQDRDRDEIDAARRRAEWGRHMRAIQNERDPKKRWNYLCDHVPNGMIQAIHGKCLEMGLKFEIPQLDWSFLDEYKSDMSKL